MATWRWMALVIWGACGLLGAADTATAIPLNGSFAVLENGFPQGWTRRGPGEWLAEERWQESGIVRLSLRPGGFVTCVSPPIPVKPETLYQFRWHCRTSRFGGARAYVYLESGQKQRVLPDVSIQGNSDWCEIVSHVMPLPGETELRLVLATHAPGDLESPDGKADFAAIAVTANPAPATRADDEMAMKFPVTRTAGMVRRGNRFALDPQTHVQPENHRHVSLEAEHGDVQFQDEGGRRADAECTYIDFVASASYTFWISRPGVYRRWLRTWRPAKARYCHHESINDEPPGPLLDDFIEKVQEWEWVPGPAYEFREAGFHRFTLHNFYAGIRLDKIMLVAETSADADPNTAVLPDTPRQYPPQGELLTASWTPLSVQEWLAFSWPANPVLPPLTLAISRGDAWEPVPMDQVTAYLTRHNSREPLRFKLILRPTAADRQQHRLANLTVADQGELRARLHPGQLITLENTAQRLLFNRENGALAGIYNRISQTWAYHQGVYSPPFTLTLFDPQSRQSRLLGAEEFRLTGHAHTGPSATFTYESDADDIGVTCRYALRQDELADWSIRVTNRNPRLLVSKTRFPFFSSLSIGNQAADDTMIFPQSYRRRLRLGERALSPNNFFPGSMAMGWVNLADASGGFYLAINDPKLILTRMFAGTAPDNDGFEVVFEKHHAVPPAGEATWNYVSGLHTGSWHWAADHYRSLSAAWLRPADIPAWLREANGLYCYSAQWQGSGLFPKLPGVYQQARHLGLDGIQVWGQQSYPKGPCGDAFYFPSPHFGSEEEFAAANLAIRALGGHVAYYQWMNWNPTYETSERVAFDTLDKSRLPDDLYIPRPGFAVDNQVITEEGKTHFFTLESMRNQPCTLMCASQPEQREYLNYYTRRYSERYHADGFYMDEGILKAKACYNLRHQHVANGEGGAAMVEALAGMLATGRRHNPDFFLTHEAPSCAAGQVSAHFVGVFEPDLDIIKYTFPQQLYLDGNLPAARQKDPFAGLRAVFMLGNHLMLFPFAGTFAGDSAALIELRRQLRHYFAYALYRDRTGLQARGDGVDCRRFRIDHAGNRGILVTVSNPGELSDATLFLDRALFAATPAACFSLPLSGPAAPLPLNAVADGFELRLPAAKVSALLLLERSAPGWRLLPLLTRRQDGNEIAYELQIVNLAAGDTAGTWQWQLGERPPATLPFSVGAGQIVRLSLSQPLAGLDAGWQTSRLILNAPGFQRQETDFIKK